MRPDAPVFHLVPASFHNLPSSPSLPEGVMNPSQPVEPQVAAADQALLRMELEDKSPIPGLIDQSVLIGAGKQKTKRKSAPKRKSSAAASKNKKKKTTKKPATKRSPVKKKSTKSSTSKKKSSSKTTKRK